MIGHFIVSGFPASNLVKAHLKQNSSVEGFFYLPPLTRQDTCDIKNGSEFFGILDDISGYGAVLVGFDNADFKGNIKYDLSIDGKIRATGAVVSDDDVTAGAQKISLKSHIHSAGESTLMSPQGPCTGVTGGPQNGV